MKQFIIILTGLFFLCSAPSMAQSMTVKEMKDFASGKKRPKVVVRTVSASDGKSGAEYMRVPGQNKVKHVKVSTRERLNREREVAKSYAKFAKRRREMITGSFDKRMDAIGKKEQESKKIKAPVRRKNR